MEVKNKFGTLEVDLEAFQRGMQRLVDKAKDIETCVDFIAKFFPYDKILPSERDVEIFKKGMKLGILMSKDILK